MVSSQRLHSQNLLSKDYSMSLKSKLKYVRPVGQKYILSEYNYAAYLGKSVHKYIDCILKEQTIPNFDDRAEYHEEGLTEDAKSQYRIWT